MEDKNKIEDVDGLLFPNKESDAEPTFQLTTKSSDDALYEQMEVEIADICLMGKYCPEEFGELLEYAQAQYDKLPILDYDALYEELANLSVEPVKNPSLQSIGDELQKVQGSKYRLGKIIVEVFKCVTIKKRICDILTDAWLKYSKESSADKRKSDSAHKMSQFNIDYSKADALHKSCSHINRNLDSLHDFLSRQITIFSLQLKLNDIKNLSSEANYQGSQADEFDYSKNKNDDKDFEENTGAKVVSF